MSTLREVYNSHNLQLLDLPMNDVKFMAALNQANLFPGDSKAKVKSQATPAEAAQCFLDNIIDKAWEDDDTNPQLDKLLRVMAKCDYSAIQSLASSISNAECVLLSHARLFVWGMVEKNSLVTVAGHMIKLYHRF